MIRSVMFDFGGVISTSPFDAFERYEQRNGLPEGFLRRVNSTNPTGSSQTPAIHIDQSDHVGCIFSDQTE